MASSRRNDNLYLQNNIIMPFSFHWRNCTDSFEYYKLSQLHFHFHFKSWLAIWQFNSTMNVQIYIFWTYYYMWRALTCDSHGCTQFYNYYKLLLLEVYSLDVWIEFQEMIKNIMQLKLQVRWIHSLILTKMWNGIDWNARGESQIIMDRYSFISLFHTFVK